ncbi:MAG: hypothetical protein AAF446_07510 [Pseudomonadota bacterium]
MLPITNHKVVHVPHALAVIAALIGLVAALSWDYHANDTDTSVISQPVVTAESSANDEINDENSDQPGGPTQTPGSSGGQAWGSNGVFPLFLPVSQDLQ